MKLKVNEIKVFERIRKDNGDIEQLAGSINEHGLMNPVTVMRSEDGYALIAGYRRLSACKSLGWDEVEATVLSPMEADEQLQLEFEENESRKEFTNAERVYYAEKLRAIEAELARKRQSEHARDGHKKDNKVVGRGAQPESAVGSDPENKASSSVKGKARDRLAKKVGYKSGRQLDRAIFLAENRPDLLSEVDKGKKSITGAFEDKARKRQVTSAGGSSPSLAPQGAQAGIGIKIISNLFIACGGRGVVDHELIFRW